MATKLFYFAFIIFVSEKKSVEDDFGVYLEARWQVFESTFQTPDKNWLIIAIRDIAYDLRNHKYNEWDRRYHQEKPVSGLIGFHDMFPMPPLRALHWKVFENCKSNFHKCVTYLHDIIKKAPLTRDDDVVTIMNKREIFINDTFSKQLHSQCRDALSYSEKSGAPFDGPMEKFQWRTTASYYMCWYTMLEHPDLSILGEPCDNHANCLDSEFGSRNRDPRADDRLFFACATYSFCPNICCTNKHLNGYNDCDTEHNPCFVENSSRKPADRVCAMNRKENQNFNDIVKNHWNVTCSCENIGFIWKSEYNMCVDINECAKGSHTCDDKSEDCLNLPGSFICICKWGFRYDTIAKQCRLSNILLQTNDTTFS